MLFSFNNPCHITSLSFSEFSSPKHCSRANQTPEFLRAMLLWTAEGRDSGAGARRTRTPLRVPSLQSSGCAFSNHCCTRTLQQVHRWATVSNTWPQLAIKKYSPKAELYNFGHFMTLQMNLIIPVLSIKKFPTVLFPGQVTSSPSYH